MGREKDRKEKRREGGERGKKEKGKYRQTTLEALPMSQEDCKFEAILLQSVERGGDEHVF